MIDPDLPSAGPPDWYLAMKAASFIGLPFTVAEGIPYTPIVRTWALIAASAESEAQEALMRRAG